MLAIIGGTGFQGIESISIEREHLVETPFGPPSAPITEMRADESRVLFLPRHGKGHAFLPSEINYRANIYALKHLGATHVLGISAVGSLVKEVHPGNLIFPSQYVDLTKGRRQSTFFGDGIVGHIATADPVCPVFNAELLEVAKAHGNGRTVRGHKTYACIEGPRLGTRAESRVLRMIGADLVGMSNVPEVFLAREAQLCYASLCVVTDYDSWLEDPSEHVNVEKVFELYYQCIEDVKNIVRHVCVRPLRANCVHCRTLQTSIIPSQGPIAAEKQAILTTLLR